MKKPTLHRLVQRHLKKSNLPCYEDMDTACKNFIQSISKAYYENDHAYRTYNRAMEISAIELNETNVKLQRQIKKNKEVEKRLRYLAGRDGLTGVYNRREFDRHLLSEIDSMSRLKKPLSLILCDIDLFKLYNDKMGHHAGDVCIRRIVNEGIGDVFKRASDFVARYGGEEFAIIVSGRDDDSLCNLIEKMRSIVEELQIPHSENPMSDFVTISAGFVTLTPDKHTTPQCTIEMADQALYQAKEKGRNCWQEHLPQDKFQATSTALQ